MKKSLGFRIVVRIFTVVQSFIAEKHNQYRRKSIECSQDSEILTPVYLLNEESGNKRPSVRPSVRPNKETEGPDIDFSSTFMEKEHIVDDGKTDDLGVSVEETLESAACGKPSVAWCEGSSNDHNT